MEPLSALTTTKTRAIFEDYEESCPMPAIWERAFHELLGNQGATKRMRLLFDIFDLNKAEELTFDGAFLMLRRTMAGMRKMVGILTPPDKVIHNMTRQIWKAARKHRSSTIVHEEWLAWWSCDASIRSALKMVTWKPEDSNGLPTPDQWTNTDYTRGSFKDDPVDDEETPSGNHLKLPDKGRKSPTGRA